jgi:hypothetical protein
MIGSALCATRVPFEDFRLGLHLRELDGLFRPQSPTPKPRSEDHPTPADPAYVGKSWCPCTPGMGHQGRQPYPPDERHSQTARTEHSDLVR